MAGYEILIIALLAMAIAEFIVFGFIVSVMRKAYIELEDRYHSIMIGNRRLWDTLCDDADVIVAKENIINELLNKLTKQEDEENGNS
ncbi:hypothetical protein [Eubacterium ramulus]|uniref:hypothetical protein n=1 Tax=Eubacterium ramulus TaxID=39490 RepID=UPI0022E4D8D6|nr:hypothetical protein [Eubacterium ramulus]